MSQKEPKGFKDAEGKTKKLLNNAEKLKKLIGSAQQKAAKKKKQMKSVWGDLQTLLRLIAAWRKKEYTEIPWKTILYVATAIFYFVNPFDIIPDFIPIGGYLDDITIITYVITSIQKDIDRFKEWEELNKEIEQ